MQRWQRSLSPYPEVPLLEIRELVKIYPGPVAALQGIVVDPDVHVLQLRRNKAQVWL